MCLFSHYVSSVNLPHNHQEFQILPFSNFPPCFSSLGNRVSSHALQRVEASSAFCSYPDKVTCIPIHHFLLPFCLSKLGIPPLVKALLSSYVFCHLLLYLCDPELLEIGVSRPCLLYTNFLALSKCSIIIYQ